MAPSAPTVETTKETSTAGATKASPSPSKSVAAEAPAAKSQAPTPAAESKTPSKEIASTDSPRLSMPPPAKQEAPKKEATAERKAETPPRAESPRAETPESASPKIPMTDAEIAAKYDLRPDLTPAELKDRKKQVRRDLHPDAFPEDVRSMAEDASQKAGQLLDNYTFLHGEGTNGPNRDRFERQFDSVFKKANSPNATTQDKEALDTWKTIYGVRVEAAPTADESRRRQADEARERAYEQQKRERRDRDAAREQQRDPAAEERIQRLNEAWAQQNAEQRARTDQDFAQKANAFQKMANGMAASDPEGIGGHGTGGRGQYQNPSNHPQGVDTRKLSSDAKAFSAHWSASYEKSPMAKLANAARQSPKAFHDTLKQVVDEQVARIKDGRFDTAKTGRPSDDPRAVKRALLEATLAHTPDQPGKSTIEGAFKAASQEWSKVTANRLGIQNVAIQGAAKQGDYGLAV
jgi:hypothetical protein